MLRALLLVVICLHVAGCATKYGKWGRRGGYSNVQVEGNTFKVQFEGNRNTSESTVETYLKYRCAELTDQNGYDYFVIIGSNTEGELSRLMSHGGAAGGVSVPRGPTWEATKHRSVALIEVYHGEKPEDDPNAFNAKELMKQLEPRIMR